MIRTLFILGIGGFTGTISRYLLALFFQKNFANSFPVGTLVINILGCFIIGIIYGLTERTHLLSEEMRLFLAVGICGSFTTYSAFAVDNMILLKQGNYLFSILYIGSSIFIGIFASFFGAILVKI